MAKSAYTPNRGDIAGYYYSKRLSGDDTAVYVDPASKRVVVASRGTHMEDPFRKSSGPAVSFGSTLKDMFSDALIATHLTSLDPREHDLEDRISYIKQKYPDFKITLTGHSLGGRLSMDVGKKLQLEAFAFNPGSGPLDTMVRDQFGPDIHVYRTQEDFVSSFLPVEDVSGTVKTKEDISAHAMEQFM